ncbi:peptidoglycan/LPS O-acetylase OafA/YrhL [Hymenobacter sp. UYP22]
MNWQATGNIVFALGSLALVVGLLLRFRLGRWLLAAVWALLTLGSVMSGDLHSLSENPDVNTSTRTVSRYCLLGGGLCALLGLALRAMASKLTS